VVVTCYCLCQLLRVVRFAGSLVLVLFGHGVFLRVGCLWGAASLVWVFFGWRCCLVGFLAIA